MISNEKLLVKKVSKILAQSSKNVPFCLEAPAMGRSIDLVFKRSGCYFAVEFKLRDWQKGVVQARDYFLACDYSYLCMPKNRITKKLVEKAKIMGIGIYAVDLDNDWPFEKILTSKKSVEKWKPAAKRVRSYLKDGC